ncbi:flagellar L-ring protein [Striga asiatica]|uniref:Flagellar L-ring protein n=1 Tax=Striga asiatica TaxID=4170 RepID=A0A5A7Q0Z0_STRAF|nr:flagellar L-ring protein [Striga asiatica]
MGLRFCVFLLLHCWVFLGFSLGAHSEEGSEVAVKLLKAPRALSNRNSAIFVFQAVEGDNGGLCSDCATNCKLDHGMFSSCEGGNVSYSRLLEGNHFFEVCLNGSTRAACTSYNWTVDTVRPTAHITTETSFTNASRISVNISFSEACGGFKCSSMNACNLRVYGPGEILPSTLDTIQPNLKYSITVKVSEGVRNGRLILVMDKNFCTDSAGNQFIRTENSSLFIHFDRRSVHVDMRTHVPERLLQINSDTRTVLATNNNKYLKVYLYFTEPVVNSSAEILNSLKLNQGSLVPINGSTFGQRRFGYQLMDISDLAIVTVSLQSDMVISRQGTPISPVPPATFLYDSERPTVKLSTTCNMRTKEKTVPILIKFVKPVFDFNSSHVSISGGHLQSFQEMTRSSYTAHIQAESDTISVSIPENITADISGNRNRASNTLQIKHYAVPVESFVLSYFVTATFSLTALIAGFLTLSTTSLLLAGAFSRPSSILCFDPARNLFRIASHLQVFAFSRWLAVTLPVEYYELTKGLQWSIPYFNLPWEKGGVYSVMVGSNSPKDRLFRVFESLQPEAVNINPGAKVFGLPLTPIEYRSYFESQNILPEADYILDPQNSHGWRDFSRSMFWLAIIIGSSIILHVILLVILKFRKQNKEKEKQSYGALIFPRFEIFLLILALPCVCEASAALIKGASSSGMIVGVLLLSLVAFLLLCLLLFLSFGITLGKLLQYKEVHQMGRKFHWYQELIRVTLGPGKRGQWTWKNEPKSIYLAILGPFFEDLRGPPKYMLSQISGGGSSLKTPPGDDRIIDSDDENEDAEAPFIQKLFGVLRIYYTLIEIVKRVTIGIFAGAYSEIWSSRTPTITLLCMTSFQLFFIVLKKPFIKKKVQLIEIISVSSQVSIFAFFAVFLDRDFSPEGERRLGISMLLVFLLSFLAEIANEWVALYMQIKRLDPSTNSFLHGLKMAFVGFFLFVGPQGLTKRLTRRFPISNETSRSINSRVSGERPWLRQIRELARSSLSKDRNKTTSISEPSTSKSRWSGLWKNKRSGSSSASTSTDFKAKPKGTLYKELEEIFASK